MTRVSVDEAAAHWGEYLKKVESGETVVVCRDERPVVEMRPVEDTFCSEVPVLGIDEGKFVVPPEFFDPLPEDLLRAFNGEDD